MATLGRGEHLEEHKLALDSIGLGEVGNLKDAHELMELLGDLLKAHLVCLHDNGHARERFVLGGGDGKGFDIEAATRDHAGDA